MVETEECVENSFSSDKPRYQSENDLFEAELAYRNKFGPSFFPGLVVNNKTYKGVLDPVNVFKAICAGFKNRPEECKGNTGPHEKPSGITMPKLLLIIGGLVLLNICLILIYRRFSRRENKEVMKRQVNSAVSVYFELNDKDTSSQRPDV